MQRKVYVALACLQGGGAAAQIGRVVRTSLPKTAPLHPPHPIPHHPDHPPTNLPAHPPARPDDQLAAEEAAAMGGVPGYCADRLLRAQAGAMGCPKF